MPGKNLLDKYKCRPIEASHAIFFLVLLLLFIVCLRGQLTLPSNSVMQKTARSSFHISFAEIIHKDAVVGVVENSLSIKVFDYTINVVRGRITKINQSDCSIAGPVLEALDPVLSGKIPREKKKTKEKKKRKKKVSKKKNKLDRHKNPSRTFHWSVKHSQGTIFPPKQPVRPRSVSRSYPSRFSMISVKVFFFFLFSRVINILSTKLAGDRTEGISALGIFFTDLAALGRPYCQDLGTIFSIRPIFHAIYGPRAWPGDC